MARLLPALLDALGRQPQPDAAFARCDQFLARLPAGVAILSLFERNPACSSGSRRSSARRPRWPSIWRAIRARSTGCWPTPMRRPTRRGCCAPGWPTRPAWRRPSRSSRRTVREEDFAISAATLEARIDADTAGLRRAALADAALEALLAPVLEDFAARYGRVRGGAMAVVLLGKAGGREMMAGSDLDLMLIYDHPEGVTESARGARALPASQWFIRAAHAYVAALTAPGADGQMYAVDMRLRPSGNKGPVAVSLAAFRRYHAEGGLDLGADGADPRPGGGRPAGRCARGWRRRSRAALAAAGPPAQIRADAAAMRARMARELPPAGPWDVKLRPGGQIEVEFIAQALQLAAAAAAMPELCHPTTREALRRLATGGMLAAADAALLIRADRLWRSVQGMLRITLGRAPPETLPEASARALLRAVAPLLAPRPVDVPALRVSLDDDGGRGARDLRAPGGGDRSMSVADGDVAPEFEMPASGGRTVSLAGAEGSARSCSISTRRRIRPAAPRKPAPSRRRCRSWAGSGSTVIGVSRDKMPADREIRRQIRAELPAGLRRRHRSGGGIRHLGREIDVRPQIHGHGTQHLPDRPRRTHRQGLAQGQRDRSRPGGDGSGGGVGVVLVGLVERPGGFAPWTPTKGVALGTFTWFRAGGGGAAGAGGGRGPGAKAPGPRPPPAPAAPPPPARNPPRGPGDDCPLAGVQGAAPPGLAVKPKNSTPVRPAPPPARRRRAPRLGRRPGPGLGGRRRLCRRRRRWRRAPVRWR